jgi:hypothetical protein
VFGDVPVSEMKPDWMPETMPDYFQLKTGTFFEIGAVYLLGSGSVGHLRELQGGTALIDRRRFRPNIYVAPDRQRTASSRMSGSAALSRLVGQWFWTSSSRHCGA